MSKIPHTRLFLRQSRAVVVSGPHVQILDAATGEIVRSTAGRDDVLKSGPVRCVAVSECEKYIATVGDDKMLKVWEAETLSVLSQRELPKKPTGVRFTRDSQTILVSDKFGDIFSYPLHPVESTTHSSDAEKPKRDAFSSHENPSGGHLILGHASLLNAFALTPDEKYIITADRDEHVRVSWYPQGYNVERYCLGHKKYISAIHIPSSDPSSLISGGGDPMLKIWDWMAGTVLHEIDVEGAIRPFIKVKGKRRKPGFDEDGDGEGEGGGKAKGKRGRKGRRGNKGKDGADAADPKADEAADSAEATPIPDPSDAQAAPPPAEAETEIVLVLHKIETFESDGVTYIIFSAVGATALFVCAYPRTGSDAPSVVQHYDFGAPVLDFVLGSDGLVWTLLDAEWAGAQDPADTGSSSDMVRIVRWTAGSLQAVDKASAPPLLSSLNTKCILPATNADLDALDLYAHLTSMPKNHDPELSSMNRDRDQDGDGDGQPKKLQARLRNRNALRGKGEKGEEDVEVGRMVKKARSRDEGAEADVLMVDAGS